MNPALAIAAPAGGDAGHRGGVWPAWRSGAARLLSRLRATAFYLALPLLLLAIWQALFELELVRAILLPPPSQVGAALFDLSASGDLPRHLGISLLRVLEGFGLAAAAGLGLGLAIGLSRRVDRATDLIVQVLKPIPPIAWIPIAILWFGIGEAAKVYIIFLGAFFPVLINTIDGIRQTDQRFVELARVLEVTRRRFITQVVIPGALPAIMTGLRVGLMVAWMCVVASELIAASSGVGYLIMDARQLSQTDIVIVGMITIGAMGKLLDVLLKRIEGRLIRWKTTFAGH